MVEKHTAAVARRSFLSRFGLGVTAAGAAVAGAAASVQSAAAQSPDAAAWQPRRHPQDDWMSKIAGSHRFVFDTTTHEGFGNALRFASTYFTASESGYGVHDADLAVIIVARHNSTPFAYNDTMWAKYGKVLAERSKLSDSGIKEVLTANIYGPTARPKPGDERLVTVDVLVKHGAHFAICQMATRRCARTIAADNGGDADAIYNELVANIVGNGHMVPAGIIAVNHAQERGYSFATGA